MKEPTNYPLFLLGNAHKKLMKTAVFKFFEFSSMEINNNKQEKALNKIERYFATQ